MKCLWISRDWPYPMDAGDRVYSGHLVQSLAAAGAQVRVLAFGPPEGIAAQPQPRNVKWTRVEGSKRGAISSLASPLPIQAAVHATPAYRRLVQACLETEDWDAVIFDSYGSAWAQPLVEAHRRRVGAARAPATVYLSHNHEASLWRGMAADAKGSAARRLALRLNAAKVARLESRCAARVDLTSAITAEDAAQYRREHPGVPSVVLTPGYEASERVLPRLDAGTPRRIVVVGSFRWVVKQENLRQFIAAADTRLAEAGIGFDVVGDVPQSLRDELAPRLRATTLHGFVDDMHAMMARARLAIVPELIGGGFKLKFLDYIFGGLPVVTLREAAAGLPAEVRRALIMADNLPAMVDAIIKSVDDLPRLQLLQREALDAARDQFDWATRGQNLAAAIDSVRSARAAKPALWRRVPAT